ncbi:MAG: phage tail sheath subtilisin-like domain-containing protein [Pseudomonadota bacterium]
MPEYLAPGVYIEETPSANKAIQGASTSTAGMVGVTERGPVGVPTLITSAGQFKRVFGGLLNHNTATYAHATDQAKDALPHAIAGFFANGGSRVYVVRVVGSAATIAGLTIKDGADDVMKICASSPGAWGAALTITTKRKSKVATTLAEKADKDAVVIKLASVFGVSVGTNLKIDATIYPVVRMLTDGNVEIGKPITANKPKDEAVTSEEFDLTVEVVKNGIAFESEIYTDLNLNPASPNYAPAVLGSCAADGKSPSRAGASTLARIHVPAAMATAAIKRPEDTYSAMKDVADAAKAPVDGTLDDTAITGTVSDDPGKRTGIQALANEPGISLVSVPGWTSVTVQKALLAHCEDQVYRFAVLDMKKSADIAGARSHRSEFDSTRGAIYYPWVTIADPFGPKGEVHMVPPSGHMLGLYARTDNARGVWKAPANEVVRGILGFDIAVNKGEQDILNPVHVNCLRDFRSEQRGLRAWGARTLSSNPEWRYVPVRRTFLFIEQSLDAGLQWAVFEPNAKPLWDTVKQSITGFLDGIWRQGGLAGVTQEQAFFVNIGYGITMEQADLDNGRLICEVGIAPVNPAEFVIIRISQKTLEAAG